MRTVVIAAAPITKEKFHPMYAQFPVSDKVLLGCMESQQETDKILSAGCDMLGLDSNECVTGMYYVCADRYNRPFEVFLADLEKKYNSARDYMRWQYEESLRQRRQNTFNVILSL